MTSRNKLQAGQSIIINISRSFTGWPKNLRFSSRCHCVKTPSSDKHTRKQEMSWIHVEEWYSKASILIHERTDHTHPLPPSFKERGQRVNEERAHSGTPSVISSGADPPSCFLDSTPVWEAAPICRLTQSGSGRETQLPSKRQKPPTWLKLMTVQSLLKQPAFTWNPETWNPKQSRSHCLQSNLRSSHRKKKGKKEMQMTGKQDEIFHLIFFKKWNAKPKRKKCPRSQLTWTTMSWAAWEARPRPHPSPPYPGLPGNRAKLAQPFKESNLVIGLKSPSAPFPAISPKAKKMGSNLKLRPHTLNQ